MDISNLSKELNMSVQELRAKLRSAGFRLSPKVRKINNNVAREIITKLAKQTDRQRVETEKESHPKTVSIPPVLTVKEFSERLGRPVTEVMKKLIENGVMATINEEIDSETAEIIAGEFGVEVHIQKEESAKIRLGLSDIQAIIQEEKEKQPRSPVVAVMGHVDHGKTTLLDTIRKTNVAGGEAGAITQHIGAYQIKHDGKFITFLDTPGHEAFAAMRARGANVTDIIILVVAADDSVKPQTMEVINRAKLTKTPMIIAINKVDKPDANVDRVKGDLAQVGVAVEDWGGKVPAVPISAKTGEGLDKLLEIILLTAEVSELKANLEGQTLGTVIESHLSRGQGPVATILVQNGTLRAGDSVLVGATAGKIKNMENALGDKLRAAGPSVPVKISGLAEMPEVGDVLKAASSLDEAKAEARELKKQERAKRLSSKGMIKADPNKKELNLIIRADAQGSLGAIIDELSKISSDDVKINIVEQGVGEINESDIQLAGNTNSTIIGFHAKTSPGVARLAKQREVSIQQYEVIYELIADITEAILAMIPVEIEEVGLGKAKIKAVFRTEKKEMIIGGVVISGRVVDKKKFRIFRGEEQIGEGKIEELQQNKIEVSDVSEGKEFGLKVRTDAKIEADDVLSVFDETVKKNVINE